jgi:hypothetical protein
MAAIVSALLCGLVFGFGLLISGMVDPNRVLGFLDVLGKWDPTLAIVMAFALLFSAPGLALARRREKPLFATKSYWPTRSEIDLPLTGGAAVFGVGWGLSGLCPGPAIVNLASLAPRAILFVAAMGIGMLAVDFWQRRETFWRPHSPEPVG